MKNVSPEVDREPDRGPFTGYTGRTIYCFENGQRWAHRNGIVPIFQRGG